MLFVQCIRQGPSGDPMRRLGAGLSARDIAILDVVRKLSRCSSNTIFELCFTSTRPTMYAVLDRLVEHRYLRRGERRYSKTGGSAEHVYALDVEGWHFFYPDTTFRESLVLHQHVLHTLDKGDVYLEFIRMERTGLITIHDLLTEPECHGMFGRVLVKPDLQAKVQRCSDKSIVNMFIEVDEGSERKRQVLQQMDTYWKAYVSAHSAKAAHVFPRPVVFGVPDTRPGRVRQLQSWIDELPEDRQKLFRAMSFSDLYARVRR